MSSTLLNSSSAISALQQDDPGAFRTLLGLLLNPGVDTSVFKRTAPMDLGNGKAKVTASIDKNNAPVQMWVYQDSQDLSYSRIKLQDVFTRWPEPAYVDFPISIRDALSIWFNKNGLFDRSAQVADGQITVPRTQAVAVSGDSFLLYGNGNLVVKQAPKYLEDVVTVTELSAFDPATSDMQGNAMDAFIAVVNDLNAAKLPRPILATEVQTSIPIQLNEYDEINTQVTLSGNNSEVFLESVVLTYHRVDFGWYLNGEPLQITGPAKPTTTYLLNQIKAKTGFELVFDDLIEDQYTTIASGTTETISVNVNPASLRYVGEITIDYTAV